MSKDRIELGDIVKDRVTEFEGTAVGRTMFINNCDRIVIQPKGVKDGKAIESRSFDEPDVVFVKAGTVKPAKVDRGQALVEMGDEVEDQLKGTTGVVMSRTEWLVGCSTLMIQPKGLKDGLPIDQQHADERDMKVLKRANPKPKRVDTGGPRPEARRAH